MSGDQGADDRGSGWLSRLFPSRDERIRSLRRQLEQAEREMNERADEVERLEAENRELRAENEAYERRGFAFDALLESVGRSFQQANDHLSGRNVVVGDLDVTLRADVSGGGEQDTLAIRLVDPDEGVDPDRLSTVSFSVGRRGRFRHYGPTSAAPEGGERGAQSPTASVLGEGPGDEGEESAAEALPSGPPVEVPDVTGLLVEDAEKRLREEGFDVHTDGDEAGTVVEQWPLGSAVAPTGSTVVVIVDESGEEE